MAATRAVAVMTGWQQWDGRIVNGKFPLRRYLGGSEESVVYLTEIGAAKAVIRLIGADAPQAEAQVACWKLAGQLSHPNLVRIFETGVWHADDEQDMHFAVVEYCEESLAEVLRQRPLTPAETRDMLLPALDALQYLHAQGIVHGEINPANVLATGDQVKLSTDSLHHSGEAYPGRAASPYDAPERSTGMLSFSADIWSLGITLVEALTTRLPACAGDGVPQLPAELPPPFDAITKGCLMPERERRLTIAGIRSLLLDRRTSEVLLKPRPVTDAQPAAMPEARKPTASGPAPPLTRFLAQARNIKASTIAGKPRLVVPAAVLLVVLAFAGGLLLLRRSTGTSTPTGAAQQNRPASAPAAGATGASPGRLRASTAGRVRHEVMPDISGQARNTINGTVKVKVRVEVNTEGRVSRATLAEHAPSSYFATHALEAARQWTFEPPIRGGRPQPAEWTLRFEFRRSGTSAAAQRTSPA
ncbi:MAG TPA: TonB family protein [Candidatus Binatia bacterium]|nr:TonB family protein [Candidatus Binatia bacterium]